MAKEAADLSAEAVYRAIEKIAHSSQRPTDLKAMRARASSMIDRFKGAVAASETAALQIGCLRQRLGESRDSPRISGMARIVFDEAFERLTDEGL
jgi:hypothetical protein